MTRDILHRDVSEGNILINLQNRNALMVDLDMAQDLQEPIRTRRLEEATAISPPARPMHDSLVSYGLSDEFGHTSRSSEGQSIGNERRLRSGTRSVADADHSDGDRDYPVTEDDSSQASQVTDSSEDSKDLDFVLPGGQAAVKLAPPPRVLFQPETLRSGRPDMTVRKPFLIMVNTHKP
jgi:hypothetical protein